MEARSLFRSSLGALALAAATAAFPTASQADVPADFDISFNLTSDHCTGTCGPAGSIFGTVFLNQNGTTLDVTVDLADGYSFAKTGAADFLAFKFNATGIVLTDITVDQNAPKPLAGKGPGVFNGDGTGFFAWGIECAACGGGGSDAFSTDIIFHIANATIADLTNTGLNPNIFVADVLAPNGNTGPVDATVANVPAPVVGAGLPGLIMACGGLLGLARRRRQKIA